MNEAITPESISLPEAIANLRKLQKFFGQLFEAQPAIKSIDCVIEAALAQPIKDEAFEQKLGQLVAVVIHREKIKRENMQRFGAIEQAAQELEAARAAVLSTHANAIAQAERVGMERAAKIVETELLGSEVNTVIRVIRDWLADRLVNVYQENPNVDFVLSCRARAKHLRALITKYKS